jgi:hypothetical protein
LKHITCHYLDSALPRTPLQTGGIADQTSDAITHLDQAWNKPPSDVAGGTGYQDTATFRIF